MKKETQSNTPDAATLAHLAAQARFAKLSPTKAVHATKELRLVAEEALRHDEPLRAPATSQARSQQQASPKPKEWPAPLHVFYRVVVRGRHEGDSNSKLLRFLTRWFFGALNIRGEWLIKPAVKKLTEDEASYKTNEMARSKAKEFINRWRSDGLSEVEWDLWADPYRQWYHDVGRFEGKRLGGKQAAKKRAEKHGTAPHQK